MSSTDTQKIVICGGGNAAHIFAALAASNKLNEVHLLSLFRTEAADFEKAMNSTKEKAITIEVTQEKRTIVAAPKTITNDPKCLAGSDVVIISLPAFAHNQYLKAIKDNVKPKGNKKTLVAIFPGASGLECEWQGIFGGNNPNFVLLSCITLPWAARFVEYGQKAEILGTKHQIEVGIKLAAVPSSDDDDEKQKASDASADDKAKYMKIVSDIIGVPPKIVDFGHVLNMSLSAVNAISHPPIMYAQWKNYDGKLLKEKPLFYHGISAYGADLMSALSDEAIAITKCVEKETGLVLNQQHIYDWDKSCYGEECTDTSSLLQCILTNPAYKGLTHPCIEENGAFKPDFKHRYLSEDIPYGLVVIRGLSLILKEKVDTPITDEIIRWSQTMLNKEYLRYSDDGKDISAGKDIGESRAPQRYGIKSIKDLI